MRPPLHQRLVDKAVAAITAAVEVYNKPAFAYRAETFAILALNGWELLLKAKVVKDEGNDLKAIRVYQARPTKSGRPSKKLFLKLNRAGNAQTISLGACIVELEKSPAKLHVEVKNNLEALTEIRDNSVHFVTANALLARQAQELSPVFTEQKTLSLGISDCAAVSAPFPRNASVPVLLTPSLPRLPHCESLPECTVHSTGESGDFHRRSSDFSLQIKGECGLVFQNHMS